MLTFHNDLKLKEEFVNRMKEHLAADEYDHSLGRKRLGFPEWYEHLRDNIFEGIPASQAPQWALDSLRCVPVGVDINPVKYKLAILRHKKQLIILKENPNDYARECEKAINQVITYLQNKINGGFFNGSTAESARAAAEAAAESAAESARAAAESARSATWSALSARPAAWSALSARSAAWSAAESARSAARSAAESAAESVALSARSAAESARSATWSAWSARSAAWSAAKSAAEAAAESAESARAAARSAAKSARSAARSATESSAESAELAHWKWERDTLISLLKELGE